MHDLWTFFSETLRVLLPQVIPSLLVVTLAVLTLRWLTQRSAEKQRGHRFRDQMWSLAVGITACVGLLLALPVDTETRGQLLTLFGFLLTAIITLSSPTIATNIMAGVMVRSLRSFSPGDFIQVGEYFGRVTEQNLFHVEIQTADRDLLTIPNAYIASNPVKVVYAGGTLVSAEVSLGYDIDHHNVEEALLEAATAAGLQDPFVYVIELGDFSVLYRVSGFLDDVKNLLSVRSRLRKRMLDHLHHQGIEIVSPAFMNQRQISGQVMPNYRQPQAADLAHEQGGPDSLVFDKAERAQQLKDLLASYEELKEDLVESEKNGIDEALKEKKVRRLKAIKRVIDFWERQTPE